MRDRKEQKPEASRPYKKGSPVVTAAFLDNFIFYIIALLNVGLCGDF